ncbi:kinesin-4-like isoform X1 [Tanacetum coccineum]
MREKKWEDAYNKIVDIEKTKMLGLKIKNSLAVRKFKEFGPSKNRILKDDNGAKKGLCELAIEELFDLMKTDHDYITWSVEFEMVAIFKDKKIGLLDTKDPSIPVEVKSFSETLELLEKGLRKRTWRGTKLNSQREAANEEPIHGCLRMVDLAGSKKLDVPIGESNSIRSGLLFFDIKYNHTLTTCLEVSLGGKSKVVVLAHVSGLEKFFSETMNTLRFANKTRKVQNGVIETLDKDLRTIQELVMASTGTGNAVTPNKLQALLNGGALKHGKGTDLPVHDLTTNLISSITTRLL